MWKKILRQLKKWLTQQPSEHGLLEIYKKCLIAINHARTVSDLIYAKKLITSHRLLTNKYELPILYERQEYLEGLWEKRYKLWKTRGY